MKRLSAQSAFSLVLDAALLIFWFVHVPDFFRRPAVPANVVEENNSALIVEIPDPASVKGLRAGDRILRWGSQQVHTEHDVEFLTDFLSIGETVQAEVQRGTETITGAVTLVPYYDVGYVICVFVVGALTVLVAVVVLLRRQEDPTARILHWSMIAMAFVVMATWEGRSSAASFPYFYSLLFYLSYAGVATTFFLFTLMFPVRTRGSLATKIAAVYFPALVVLVPLIVLHTRAVHERSVALFEAYQGWFDLFHVSLFLYIGGGIVNFIRAYRRAGTSTERKKLKWILFGLCLGPTPFLLLNVLPGLFAAPWTPPEEYTLMFLVVIPVAFAISFIRYHVMDIEVVINRTTVYAIVIGALTAAYVLIVGSVAALAGSLSVQFSAAAAIAMSLLFQPLRTRVQHFVDRRFFRVQYDFRKASRAFLDEIKHSLNVRQLAELMVARTSELIPVDRIGFFGLGQPGRRLYVIAHRDFDIFERHRVRFAAEDLKSSLQLPVGVHDAVEPGVRFEQADEEVFGRWGMALVYPMLSESAEILGFLVLGRKKSGARFSVEDVDLLATATAQAALAIERLNLQGKLLIEHEQAERLEELSRLKSEFVSYVSHELRTPLASIKLFSELLETRLGRIRSKPKEFLSVIRGEADRLDRMVTTILDSARIDQGAKEYRLVETDLREVASQVMTTMKYQLDKQGFRVEFRCAGRRCPVRADPDAVSQALINLISNAIKYSGERRFLRVSLLREDGWALCKVTDHGRGISPEALPHLFERFYRDPDHRDLVQGVGLGLPLVKHIMNVHGGTVRVESKPGKGSTFTLAFPQPATPSVIEGA